MNILDQIIETKRSEIAVAKKRKSFDRLYGESVETTRAIASFSEALSQSHTGIIAEFKRKSPSKGFIHRDAGLEQIVRGYSGQGASAISVLTDETYFGGKLSDLELARTLTNIPLLRKDFIIDPYQISEARIAGADVVLLIAAALTQMQCVDLAAFAASLGLEVLLEVHDESELGHINPHVDVVGVNNRDLTTFVTDIAISEYLAALIPDGYMKISESGISSPQTVKQLRQVGFRGFLMGEIFMKQSDPAATLGRFITDLKQ